MNFHLAATTLYHFFGTFTLLPKFETPYAEHFLLSFLFTGWTQLKVRRPSPLARLICLSGTTLFANYAVLAFEVIKLQIFVGFKLLLVFVIQTLVVNWEVTLFAKYKVGWASLTINAIDALWFKYCNKLLHFVIGYTLQLRQKLYVPQLLVENRSLEKSAFRNKAQREISLNVNFVKVYPLLNRRIIPFSLCSKVSDKCLLCGDFSQNTIFADIFVSHVIVNCTQRV